MLGDGVAKVRVRNLFAVLRGDNHAIDARRAAIAVLDGDLRLSIRPEKINFVGFTNLGEALREVVGELDRHGHQFFSFIASKPKHQALVASSTGINAHGDVRRLPLHGAHDGAGIRVVAVLGAIVADAADGGAYELVVIDVRAGSNFTSDDGNTRGDKRLAGDAAFRVVPHDLVKDGVRNLVGNFVRMALGDGLRRK